MSWNSDMCLGGREEAWPTRTPDAGQFARDPAPTVADDIEVAADSERKVLRG